MPSASDSTAPDLVIPVVGFRQWRLQGTELVSLAADDPWVPGVQTAYCTARTHAHPAPAKGCTCGIHAWYSPPPRGASAATPDLVAGAVVLWGVIELHAHGMRAQHGLLVALALPFSRGGKRRRLLAAAEAHGVAAVAARRLQAAALAHGELIPRAMRPPDVMPNKRQAPGPPDPARWHAVTDGYAAQQTRRRRSTR